MSDDQQFHSIPSAAAFPASIEEMLPLNESIAITASFCASNDFVGSIITFFKCVVNPFRVCYNVIIKQKSFLSGDEYEDIY